MMSDNPTIGVEVKEKGEDEEFLPNSGFIPININKMSLDKKIEYLLSTAITVFLWTYFTISAGFVSYNLVLKENIDNPLFSKIDPYLSAYRDCSDEHWFYFRDNYFVFLFYALFFIFAGKSINVLFSADVLKKIYIVFGLLFCFYLCQYRLIIILIASFIFFSLNYLIKYVSQQIYQIFCWITLIILKFLIDYLIKNNDINKITEKKYLPCIDQLGWKILLTLCLIKMMSFNLEYKKSFYNEATLLSVYSFEQAKNHCDDCRNGDFCLKCLENVTAEKLGDFNLLNYFVYIFYPPLLYTGPLINFNSFIFQINNRASSEHNKLNKMNKLKYSLELVLYMVIMELYNHYLFPTFIFKFLEPEKYLSLFYYCFIAFNVLTFIWLKFTIIWKNSRLWAWCDGIYTEDNSNRFIYNLYSLEEFFRGWDRGLYKWLFRYLYIPLGGKNKKYLLVWLVFGFFYIIFDIKNNDYGYFFVLGASLVCLEEIVKEKIIEKYGEDFNNNIFLRYGKYLIRSIFITICYFIMLLCFGLGFGKSYILNYIWSTGSFFSFILMILFILPNCITIFFIRDMEIENSIKEHKEKKNY